MARISVSDEIVNALTEDIRDKVFQPGDKLPNENTLSERFECSRIAVREALKVLSAKGLITTKHGEGSFVNAYNPQMMAETLDNLFLLSDQSLIETMQLRKIMEVEAARLCSKNATPEEIEEIESYRDLREDYCQKEANEENIQKKYAYDRLFHLAIAKGSHNELFVQFIQTIQQSLALHQTYSASEETKRHTSMYHNEILKAIQSHDSERAAEMMRAHLSKVEEALIQSIQQKTSV